MIEKLNLKFGPSQLQAGLEIPVKPVTIFVGPNNSGKSQILRDINTFCQGGALRGNLIEEISLLPVDDIETEITKLTIPPNPGEQRVDTRDAIVGKRGQRIQVNRDVLRSTYATPHSNIYQFCQYYLQFYLMPLEGGNRLQLVEAAALGDLKQPVSKLQVLFTDDTKRKEVRRIVYDAFRRYFTIDPTSNGRLSIRLSDKEPSDPLERSLTDEAVEFHRNNLPIEATSDGVRAFIGLIISIISDDPKIITLDEPEAFLHPSLSSKLGKEIGNLLINEPSKRLFVATHSANFLMGCLQSGVPINIVRLTYSNKVPTARLLPSERISKLIKHPLLRSVGTLNGLFYEYVVVTESDSDRAFYQEINERLLQFSPANGISNCLFLNAQNKQTIHEIVKPLREMGIPCVGIVDIDALSEGGTNWANLMNCGFVPEGTRSSTEVARKSIHEKFVELCKVKDELGNKELDGNGNEKSNKKYVKTNGGISLLDYAGKQSAEDLLSQLETYGLFIVRNGELESWLKPLGATGHSPKWLIEIFDKMGEDPNSSDYVRPSSDDVWEFLGTINRWFTDPDRKGIPD